MRVISGNKKGMKLFSTRDPHTRPTEDRIKESVFNVLSNIEKESYVLDLFAGTGGIGIEFLSRGAEFVVFSEMSRSNIHCILDNLKHTGLEKNAKIYSGDYIGNLYNIKKEFSNGFDYIFIDPPYEKIEMYHNSLNLIKKLNLLEKDGIIIIESNEILNLNDYNIIKEKQYGKKIVYFVDLGERNEDNLSR